MESSQLAHSPHFQEVTRYGSTQNQSVVPQVGAEGEAYEVVIGCPWTTEEFTAKAVERGHPADDPVCVPRAVALAMCAVVLCVWVAG